MTAYPVKSTGLRSALSAGDRSGVMKFCITVQCLLQAPWTVESSLTSPEAGFRKEQSICVLTTFLENEFQHQLKTGAIFWTSQQHIIQCGTRAYSTKWTIWVRFPICIHSNCGCIFSSFNTVCERDKTPSHHTTGKTALMHSIMWQKSLTL